MEREAFGACSRRPAFDSGATRGGESRPASRRELELLAVEHHLRSAAAWLTESCQESDLRILVATTARVRQPGKQRSRRTRVTTVASPHFAAVDAGRGGR